MPSEDNPSFESRMQVDEPADGYASPTTLTIPPTQPRVSISDETLQVSCKLLEHIIKSSHDDDLIRKFLTKIWFIVHQALEEDPDLSIRRVVQEEFLKNIGEYGEQQFIDFLRDMAKRKSWWDLFGNAVFLKKPEWSLTPASMNASLRAWNSAFKGEAADVLIQTIACYLGQRGKPDSMQTCFVNSSGTGKSRIVHEVARKIITVPMCLRLNRTQGFPPPDVEIRGWLNELTYAQPDEQGSVAKKLHDFMSALLIVLLKHLQEIESKEHFEEIKSGECRIPRIPSSYDPENHRLHEDLVKERQAKLASRFCDLMTSDISFESHNDYRVHFYKEVMVELEERSRKPQELYLRKPLEYIYEVKKGVQEAGNRLCRFIDPFGVLEMHDGPRWPLVILAFDESHILTEFPKSCDWNLFSELCRTLEVIVQRPIFSLFLSTAGSFHRISPERKIKSDPSSRVINPNPYFLSPITEISFDDLGYLAKEDAVSLSQVVTTDWISHLGRPLFGAYYDALAGNERELLLLAKQKLLNGSSILVDGDSFGSFACLSVRFALELNEDAISRDVAYTQVGRHMRLCLAATTGFEILKTITGSEPLLAEAAEQLMYDSGVNPVCHLAKHPDFHCLDGRWHGELVVALLLMQARDVAVGTQPPTQRWVSISDFMQALLPREKYVELQRTLPTSWRAGEDKSFAETFQEHAMWFNHIIRIEEDEMINDEYLWMFITRGAMIIDTHNQNGVDIVLPLCLKTGKLSRKTVSAIIIQVKNSGPYGYNIEKTLFNGPCPFEVGLFNEGSTPRPVIRMVFTLTSSESGVRFPATCEHPCVRDHGDFTAFDIWCAGLSSFKNIDKDLTSYQILLDRLRHPRGVLDLEDDKYLDDVTRQSRRLLRQRMAALPTFQDDDD